MPYEIEKFSPKTLKTLLSVLDYIKIKSELRNRKRLLRCRLREIDGVSESDREWIMSDLSKHRIVLENIFLSSFFPSGNFIISIGEPFFVFYDKVILQMKTAGKTKKKTESEVVKILGITEKTKWEDITIEFKNPYDVKIKSKGKSFDSDYEKMGFADKRKNTKLDTKTKASWDLLKLFSTTENQKFPLSKLDDKEKVKRKKQKQELSKLLKAFFQISDDPIMHNETANEYHMRIKLIPEETFRGQWADRNIFEENSP